MSRVDSGLQDRRLVVLIVVGLGLCLQHLPWGKLAGNGTQPQPVSPLVWLEPANGQASGLYSLAGMEEDWLLGLSHALGYHPPTAMLPTPEANAFVPAYRLPAGEPAQRIPTPAQAAPLFFQPIPINQASLETLTVIPGIGKRLAAAIIAYRQRTGAIHDRDSLLAIEGIGEKKAAAIVEYVRFD